MDYMHEYNSFLGTNILGNELSDSFFSSISALNRDFVLEHSCFIREDTHCLPLPFPHIQEGLGEESRGTNN